jgi:hypothetical protein
VDILCERHGVEVHTVFNTMLQSIFWKVSSAYKKYGMVPYAREDEMLKAIEDRRLKLEAKAPK